MVAKYKLVYVQDPNIPFDWENHPNEDVQLIGNLLQIASTNSVSYRKRSVCLRAAHRILRLGNYTQSLRIGWEATK